MFMKHCKQNRKEKVSFIMKCPCSEQCSGIVKKMWHVLEKHDLYFGRTYSSLKYKCYVVNKRRTNI